MKLTEVHTAIRFSAHDIHHLVCSSSQDVKKKSLRENIQHEEYQHEYSLLRKAKSGAKNSVSREELRKPPL
jgi:hypothetical protein